MIAKRDPISVIWFVAIAICVLMLTTSLGHCEECEVLHSDVFAAPVPCVCETKAATRSKLEAARVEIERLRTELRLCKAAAMVNQKMDAKVAKRATEVSR